MLFDSFSRTLSNLMNVKKNRFYKINRKMGVSVSSLEFVVFNSWDLYVHPHKDKKG